MANPNPKKIETVKRLAEMIKSAKSVVFVDYTGLDVKSQQALKQQLKEAGASMLVAKNSLIKLALGEKKVEELQGQTAIVLSGDDEVSPIQILGKFAQQHELPQFKSGFVENAFQDKSALEKISLLPSKDELFAQTVGSISAPLYSLVGTLQGNLQKFIFILNTKAQIPNAK